MQHSLTTTAAEVVSPQSYPRPILFSAGLWDGSTTVYLRSKDSGDSDAILSRDGIGALRLLVPAGVRIFAHTDSGTAELCTIKEEMP